jgi:predicted Zn-dependent peptidase
LSRLGAFELEDFTLENGLRVLVAPDPQRHRAHVALHVRTGSRFETPETNGLSHFLEHMIYRGTPRLPSAHAVNDAFERIGGYLYAATQTDFGIFSMTLPRESLDAASALFGEVLRTPAFLDIEVEQEIVCEEILEDKDDDGRDVDADNLSRGLIYPAHPLGFTITGDEAHVRSFDLALLRAHHARHYVARGSVLTFTGAIERKEAERLARRDFAALESIEPDGSSRLLPGCRGERAGAPGARSHDARHRRRHVDAALPSRLRRPGALLRRERRL